MKKIVLLTVVNLMMVGVANANMCTDADAVRTRVSICEADRAQTLNDTQALMNDESRLRDALSAGDFSYKLSQCRGDVRAFESERQDLDYRITQRRSAVRDLAQEVREKTRTLERRTVRWECALSDRKNMTTCMASGHTRDEAFRKVLHGSPCSSGYRKHGYWSNPNDIGPGFCARVFN